MIAIPQCFACKHFYRDRPGKTECDAFPGMPGIPEDILTARFDHTKPHAGDHGIRFEEIPNFASKK